MTGLSHRVVTGTFAAVLGASALAGCGAKSHNGGTASSTNMKSHQAGAMSSTHGTKNCSSSYTSAMIGGQTKCITAGQQCQKAHKSDYTSYGFICEEKSGRYVLVKK